MDPCAAAHACMHGRPFTRCDVLYFRLLQTVMVAWGELMVKDRPAQAGMQLASHGNLVASVSNAAGPWKEALLTTQAALREMVPAKGEAPLSTRLKNV